MKGEFADRQKSTTTETQISEKRLRRDNDFERVTASGDQESTTTLEMPGLHRTEGEKVT